MADWSKPALASTYANFVPETNARDTDLAVMFDPAVVTPTNFPTSTVRWRSAANKWEKWNGTVWSDLAATYAINISGNAATASALSSAPGSVLEVGRYFDFHSAANGYDYDVRLDAQAGASAGDGTLVITASNVAATLFTGALAGNATTATNAGGSSFATQATADVGRLIAQKSGQNPAYLFNNDIAWGLYSESGGGMAWFDRATGKFRFNGNAETATWAVNGGVTSVNGQTGAVTVTGVPAGAVMHFAMSTPPSGWLIADGATVSRTTYAALYLAIGTTFGAGNGSTTFNLPDLRGEFVRGHDNGRGVDSGRVFGSYQEDSLKSHTHTYVEPVLSTNPLDHDTSLDWDRSVTTTTGTSSATGGTETRPRNVALLACIKF